MNRKTAGMAGTGHIADKPSIYIFTIYISGAGFAVQNAGIRIGNSHTPEDSLYIFLLKMEFIVVELFQKIHLFQRRYF